MQRILKHSIWILLILIATLSSVLFVLLKQPKGAALRDNAVVNAGSNKSDKRFAFEALSESESITQLKYPNAIGHVVGSAGLALRQVLDDLNGKYGQIREWNGRFSLNLTNQNLQAALFCSFYSSTGNLKQVDTVLLEGSQHYSLMTFYPNGTLKLFSRSREGEGIQFFDDGKPEFLYSQLPDGKEYSVTWNRAGQVTHEMIR